MNARRLIAVLLLVAVAGCVLAATDVRLRTVSRDAGLSAVAAVGGGQVQTGGPARPTQALGLGVADGCTDAALTPAPQAMSGGPADRRAVATITVHASVLGSRVTPLLLPGATALLPWLPSFGLAVTAISVCRT